LTAEEINEFRSINTEQRLLQSEADKLQLRQNNTFLQIQIRTSKKDLTGWGVDIQRGMCVPPQPIKEAEKAS
jgi:hypothetical protein